MFELGDAGFGAYFIWRWYLRSILHLLGVSSTSRFGSTRRSLPALEPERYFLLAVV